MATDSAAIDTTTPAVVLKFDPNVMHHGGLGVIRSLGRAGVPVYGVHEGPLGSGRQLAVPRRTLLLAAGSGRCGARGGLLRLAERIGRPSVLITTDDAGAIFLAEHGRDLRDWFLFPRPPENLPRKLAWSNSPYQVCLELGVPCPRASLPESLGDARAFATEVGYPLIAKLTTPWTAGSGLHSTSVVAGEQRLTASIGCASKPSRTDAAGVHPRRAGP